MVLSKKDALLVRSVVFSFLLKDRNAELQDSLQNLLYELDSFLLNNSTDTCEDDCEHEENHDDEVDELEVDDLLSVDKFMDLPRIEVERDGKKTLLEFEESEESDDSIVAVFGDYDETFEVVALEVTEDKICLHKSEGGVAEFVYSKMPKRWLRLINTGKLYGVGSPGKDEEE